MSTLPEEFFAAIRARSIAETRLVLWVSVTEQRLHVFLDRRPAAEYAVSTATNGVGCRRDSFQTPTGLHRIARKIGDGQPRGTIFKERTPTTSWKPEIRNPKPETISNRQSVIGSRQSDLILTRILWLEGLEPGVNRGGEVDTFHRYIYIHGTNHEDLIGQPASHGCVRMRNDDVMGLFETVEIGTLVWIG